MEIYSCLVKSRRTTSPRDRYRTHVRFPEIAEFIGDSLFFGVNFFRFLFVGVRPSVRPSVRLSVRDRRFWSKTGPKPSILAGTRVHFLARNRKKTIDFSRATKPFFYGTLEKEGYFLAQKRPFVSAFSSKIGPKKGGVVDFSDFL